MSMGYSWTTVCHMDLLGIQQNYIPVDFLLRPPSRK